MAFSFKDITYWVMPLFKRSCHDPVNAHVPCCDISSCSSTSMINRLIVLLQMPFSNESSAAVNRWPMRTSYGVIIYDVITGRENVYINNPWQKTGRAACEVVSCLVCHDMHRLICNVTYLGYSPGQILNWPIGVNNQHACVSVTIDVSSTMISIICSFLV